MEITIILASSIIAIMIFWYFINMFRVMVYERKINSVETTKQKKIDELKKRTGMTTSFFEASIKKINSDHEPELTKLRRERQFILDRLPFLKN